MKKIISSLLIALSPVCLFYWVAAQNNSDPVLLTIAGGKISKSEFEKIYKKNNPKDASFDKKTIQEYLDLYINFKLKVKEAEELGLDTTKAFKDELASYRKQLAQPYLTDKAVTDKLLKEAYERMQKDVRASHILVKLSQDALPRDTIAAYDKIMKIRERILKGANFADVAKEVSDDPSAKENGGDLGYFTIFQMVYPFETVAYNTKPSNLSMPVRTRFGYHLIKVIDVRPALGEIHTAHIMIKSSKGATTEDSLKARTKIEEIYKKLLAGENFQELAKQFSEDPGSAEKGGVLPWFGTERMVPEFEKAAYDLKKNGDISSPVKTAFGWHIVKRLDRKETPSYEEIQGELKTRISKDSRSEISKLSFVQKVKKEYNFTEYPKAKEELYKVADSSLAEGKWSAEKAKNLNKPLFSLLDKVYTQQDFAKFIASNQTRKKNISSQSLVSALYEQFVNESCVAFEESRLEIKYPEFKALMQEYRDGILLFDLTDKKVWSKAVKDTVGLKEFYENNKNNYMWNERLDATIYTCANPQVAMQTRKLLKKKRITKDEILAEVNKDSQLNLSIKGDKFSLGDEAIVDSIKWEKGITKDMKVKNSVVFVEVNEKIPPQPKTLEEAKGLVTSDYQAYLETEWIENLRKKYTVVVNSEVLSTIVQ